MHGHLLECSSLTMHFVCRFEMASKSSFPGAGDCCKKSCIYEDALLAIDGRHSFLDSFLDAWALDVLELVCGERNSHECSDAIWSVAD